MYKHRLALKIVSMYTARCWTPMHFSDVSEYPVLPRIFSTWQVFTLSSLVPDSVLHSYLCSIFVILLALRQHSNPSGFYRAVCVRESNGTWSSIWTIILPHKFVLEINDREDFIHSWNKTTQRQHFLLHIISMQENWHMRRIHCVGKISCVGFDI